MNTSAESIAEPTAAPCCLQGPPYACEHWRQFDAAMIVSRCRWLLTLEARGIATRLVADGSFNAQLLQHQLLFAIAHAKPRSRLIPWHLSDRVVERIVAAVVQDVAETWT